MTQAPTHPAPAPGVLALPGGEFESPPEKSIRAYGAVRMVRALKRPCRAPRAGVTSKPSAGGLCVELRQLP